MRDQKVELPCHPARSQGISRCGRRFRSRTYGVRYVIVDGVGPKGFPRHWTSRMHPGFQRHRSRGRRRRGRVHCSAPSICSGRAKRPDRESPTTVALRGVIPAVRRCPLWWLSGADRCCSAIGQAGTFRPTPSYCDRFALQKAQHGLAVVDIFLIRSVAYVGRRMVAPASLPAFRCSLWPGGRQNSEGVAYRICEISGLGLPRRFQVHACKSFEQREGVTTLSLFLFTV